MPAEVSSNLARYDGIRFGSKKDGQDIVDEYFKTKTLYGAEVKRRIILGTYILSEGYSDQYYNRALALREKIREEFKKVIENLDAIIFPTAPTPAFKIGENEDPINMYLADIYTVSSSIIGNPAISVPAGNIE
jgi:aspartyl-tRNA(Asn)/glutamyl-tRNA(Gln) amidotransferase subunit A